MRSQKPWTVRLPGHKARAKAASAAIERLLDIRREFIQQIRHSGVRGVAVDLACDLIGYPILAVSDVVDLYDVTFPTKNAAVDRLVRNGLLRETIGGSYGRIFRCDLVYRAIAEA